MRLGEADAIVVPANTKYTLSDPTADFQLLDITLPANVPATAAGVRRRPATPTRRPATRCSRW